MLTLPPLPETLIVPVAALAWSAVNWLYHSPLPVWINVLIALGVPPVIALAWALTIGAFLGHSLWQDIAIIVLLSYAALALPQLEGWRSYLQDALPSPLAKLAPAVTVRRRASLTTTSTVEATTMPMSPYPTPQAMALPTTRRYVSASGIALPCHTTMPANPPARPAGMDTAVSPPRDDDGHGDPVPAEV